MFTEEQRAAQRWRNRERGITHVLDGRLDPHAIAQSAAIQCRIFRRAAPSALTCSDARNRGRSLLEIAASAPVSSSLARFLACAEIAFYLPAAGSPVNSYFTYYLAWIFSRTPCVRLGYSWEWWCSWCYAGSSPSPAR